MYLSARPDPPAPIRPPLVGADRDPPALLLYVRSSKRQPRQIAARFGVPHRMTPCAAPITSASADDADASAATVCSSRALVLTWCPLHAMLRPIFVAT